MHRCEFTKTETGIVIGGAYVRPSEWPSEDAEVLQKALLRRQRAADLRGLLEVAVVIISIGAMVASVMWGS
jgi:hypothetical protein